MWFKQASTMWGSMPISLMPVDTECRMSCRRHAVTVLASLASSCCLALLKPLKPFEPL
jgi:hypothetical protein